MYHSFPGYQTKPCLFSAAKNAKQMRENGGTIRLTAAYQLVPCFQGCIWKISKTKMWVGIGNLSLSLATNIQLLQAESEVAGNAFSKAPRHEVASWIEDIIKLSKGLSDGHSRLQHHNTSKTLPHFSHYKRKCHFDE